MRAATVLLAIIAISIVGIRVNVHADDGQPLYLPLIIRALTWPPPAATPTVTPTAIATATPTPSPIATATRTPSPATPVGANLQCTTRPGSQLCAWISNPTPLQNSTVTAYARLYLNGAAVPGQLVTTTWHYKSTTPTETCATAYNGIAACTRDIGRATAGYTVIVDVAAGALSTSTWFTPQ